jgi:uncharacterized protein YggE
MNALRSTILIAAVLSGSLAATAFLQSRTGMAQDADKIQRTVTVSATGKVTADPDIAYISAGVVTEANAAEDAINRNNAVMTKLIDGLKRAGIDAKDIRTTAVNVGPRYAQPKDGRPPAIEGYRVVNQVRLTVRDVKRLGEVLDQAIALGANQVSQVIFEVADAETLKDTARKQAMENARRRGELYAQAAGGQLGLVLRVAETVGGLQPFDAAADSPFVARRGVPIEAGTRSLEVEVHVVYALR